MDAEFQYRNRGRKPVIWVAAALHIPLFWLGWQFQVPTWCLGIWALSAAMVTWSLVANRSRGLRITREHLVLNAWINPQDVPLHDILRVTLKDLSNRVEARLQLRNGKEVSLDERDHPKLKIFQRELESRGVQVVFA